MVDMKVHAVGTKRGAMCGRLHDQRTVLFSLAGTFWQAGFPQLNALASCSLLLSPAMDPQLHEYRAAQQARFEASFLHVDGMSLCSRDMLGPRILV